MNTYDLWRQKNLNINVVTFSLKFWQQFIVHLYRPTTLTMQENYDDESNIPFSVTNRWFYDKPEDFVTRNDWIKWFMDKWEIPAWHISYPKDARIVSDATDVIPALGDECSLFRFDRDYPVCDQSCIRYSYHKVKNLFWSHHDIQSIDYPEWK